VYLIVFELMAIVYRNTCTTLKIRGDAETRDLVLVPLLYRQPFVLRVLDLVKCAQQVTASLVELGIVEMWEDRQHAPESRPTLV
jgi:hypothetical protein